MSRLKDHYKIISGYTFRDAIPETDDGNLYLLQAKKLSEHFFIKKELLPKIHMEKPNTEAYVWYNDVVLSSRGNIEASVIKSGETNILASSSVFIFRPVDQEIISDYLAVYFNSSKGQHELQRFFSTGSIQAITKSDLKEVRVPIPTIKKQKRIVNIHRNIFEQKQLFDEKIGIYNTVLNSIIYKFN